jgi:hypothetical protein
MQYRDYPCVIDKERCANKQVLGGGMGCCHGALDPRCYVNWCSTDPEDIEPYEQYLAELSNG